MSWTLIKHRLPPKEGYYIFQIANQPGAKIHEYYFDGKNLVTASIGGEAVFDVTKVFAWQPLPLRYPEDVTVSRDDMEWLLEMCYGYIDDCNLGNHISKYNDIVKKYGMVTRC